MKKKWISAVALLVAAACAPARHAADPADGWHLGPDGINATDLAILKATFGSTVLATGGSPISTSPIPKPATLTLLGTSGMALLHRRRTGR